MRIEDEVEKMRKEIVELEQLLEIQRLQNMAWWELKELSPELCAILDRIEEAWYLMKEAELQATYMQGISDGMDMQKEKLRRVC